MIKEETPFYPYWLRPTKTKIILSSVLSLVLIFSALGPCTFFHEFDYCLVGFVREYYAVIIGFILVSYFLVAWMLELSIFARKKSR